MCKRKKDFIVLLWRCYAVNFEYTERIKEIGDLLRSLHSRSFSGLGFQSTRPDSGVRGLSPTIPARAISFCGPLEVSSYLSSVQIFVTAPEAAEWPWLPSWREYKGQPWPHIHMDRAPALAHIKPLKVTHRGMTPNTLQMVWVSQLKGCQHVRSGASKIYLFKYCVLTVHYVHRWWPSTALPLLFPFCRWKQEGGGERKFTQGWRTSSRCSEPPALPRCRDLGDQPHSSH